ncbi:Transcription-repair-coupling factor [bioreactor metagenome]|uniref:Transcription-repair-coupling factor n=1 Tax=bioreactor metagenome TaxID=1076179 RepID=A0A645F4G2_9ZZZZ
MLSEIATKRLMAIKEYTEFGSGFKLALRDLEIRGAGNLLGAQQSGHIDTVGYDLYMRLLNEAVLEEKGEYVAPKDESTIDLTVDAYIPEKYVESSKMRIDIYKKIAACENDDDLSDLTDELIDRFGDIPRPVDNLFRVSKIKRMAQNVHIKKITQQEQIITFILGAAPDIEAVMLLKPVYTSRLNIELDEKPRFSLRLSHAAASNSTLPGGIAGSVSPSQLSLDTTDEVLAHLEGFSKK